MRWRFVDRIEAFEPWRTIRGRKAISLEEYSLLAPWGRDGEFPESLVLESCVELGRWLVAASSSFELAAVMAEAEDLRFEVPAGMGMLLRIAARAERRTGTDLSLQCQVHCSPHRVALGQVRLEFVSLAEHFDPDSMKAVWEDLYGAA